jgi:hypothetical protein
MTPSFIAFHAVQQAVHERQPAGAGDEFHADEGFVALEGALLFVEVVEVVGLGLDPGVGGDQETGGADGRVLHGFAGLRVDQGDDAVD